MSRGLSVARTRRTGPVWVLAVASVVVVGVYRVVAPPEAAPVAAPSSLPAPSASVTPEPVPTIPAAASAPNDLPVITYLRVPSGFPADPEQHATAPIAEAFHPSRRLALYDRPGGRPLAFLPPTIRGVPVTVPIAARKPGWAAVLLPSVNRRIGWLPAHGWVAHPLHDLVLVRLSTHKLVWLRDGVPQGGWIVAVGSKVTPTPLGRTFVLGRTGTRGTHYGGVDALVLGAVPDDRNALAPGLQDAHTGIHAWYRPSVFGRSVSNGCVRMPKAAQEILLRNLTPGTPVIVIP